MAKDKISDYSSTANSNTDIAGINIDEGCAPSGINDAIRTLMAQLKNFQTGTGGDSFNGPFAGTTIAATDTTDASSTTAAAMKTAGGLAVAKKAYIGLDANIYGLTVGRGAGSVSTNTAVGASALAANTTGDRNFAVGGSAMAANTTGVQNAASGYYALTTQTTGNYNAAFGAYALTSNTTASNNTASGYASLYSNTTGANNVGIGFSSLFSNTTASNNTAVGYQAGYSNTTGTVNVFFGRLAGYYSTGSSNTCIGEEAGYYTTGSNNTYLGYGAGAQSSGSTGSYNTLLGNLSGYLITTGSKNTVLGCYNGNQGSLDIRTASNYIVLSDGDGNPKMVYDPSLVTWRANDFYNTTTANAANMNIGTDGGVRRSTSALKYKQDVRDVEDFDISTLRPVRYKSKCEGDDQTKDHLGLIADEAAEAGFEELVTRGADGQVEGFQYERLTVVLLKKLQVLEAEVKALKGQA